MISEDQNTQQIRINWFPGHMSKALKMMEKEIAVVDAVLYVLDSRAPFSCVNPKFTQIIKDKPVIYVFNKVDMAEDSKVKDWMKYFTTLGGICVSMDSTTSGLGKKVENAIREACIAKIEKYKKKGMNATLRALVLGVPNCGKSTLINNLCGKSKTITGNIAGVTRGKQWVTIASGIEILDTPGTLWPTFDNNRVARTLAYLGSIKEDVVDMNDLAYEFIKDIVKIDKSILEDRYQIEIYDDEDTLEILDDICHSRRYLLRGGDLDYDRCCMAIISDFKAGRLGRITLETVKDLSALKKNDRKQANDKK